MGVALVEGGTCACGLRSCIGRGFALASASDVPAFRKLERDPNAGLDGHDHDGPGRKATQRQSLARMCSAPVEACLGSVTLSINGAQPAARVEVEGWSKVSRPPEKLERPKHFRMQIRRVPLVLCVA